MRFRGTWRFIFYPTIIWNEYWPFSNLYFFGEEGKVWSAYKGDPEYWEYRLQSRIN